MNTKLLMTVNALTMGSLGIVLSFLPEEIATYLQLQSDSIILQLLGALYVGFSLLNWMNKEKILGGIYGRPIVMANFTHYMIGGLALFKLVMKSAASPMILALTSSYIIFGLAFGYMAFTHPKLKS